MKAYMVGQKLIQLRDQDLARRQYRYALTLREIIFYKDQLVRLQKESPNILQALKQRKLAKL